ncbi:hypothetical protein [Streptomyces sp. NTK 937]|uniref:hypothetical protein n=1 Tax=Streptomyces sp. NTK 937 TaxID=1487711 RepID=UPI0004A94CCA|nr:hypothetical protein [Streptomyces sp. NTK 937]KDQ65719.1 hypothetical protein DT87_00235 [Streptomyces sp. NTK 937]
MATNGSLNDMEQWRSVVEYQRRKRNPEYTYQTRYSAPEFLDEWEGQILTDVRGPYQSAENARRQASRDASARGSAARVVRTYIERASLAWEPFDERDPETKKWGGS